jgi:hypothetical protein
MQFISNLCSRFGLTGIFSSSSRDTLIALTNFPGKTNRPKVPPLTLSRYLLSCPYDHA